MFFRKYQFPSKQIYRELLSSTEISMFSTIAELGTLVENTYSVDALWVDQLPEMWTEYEIWDIEGNGAHTFAGWNFDKPNIID